MYQYSLCSAVRRLEMAEHGVRTFRRFLSGMRAQHRRTVAFALALTLGALTSTPVLAAFSEALASGNGQLGITGIAGDIAVTGIAPVVTKGTFTSRYARARAEAEGTLTITGGVGSTLDVSSNLSASAGCCYQIGLAGGSVLGGGFLLENQGQEDGGVTFSVDYLFDLFVQEGDGSFSRDGSHGGGGYAGIFYEIRASNLGEIFALDLGASSKYVLQNAQSATDAFNFFVPLTAGESATVGVSLRSFAIATVPVPAAAPLLAGGLGLLAAIGRVRRRPPSPAA